MNNPTNITEERKYHIDKALEHLSGQDDVILDYLGNIVASICNIEKGELFGEHNYAYAMHAKWMYWHTLRYVTSYTYKMISLHTKKKFNKDYTANGIGQAINKMSALIEKEPMWKKRWTILKRIIKEQVLIDDNAGEDRNIIIQVPKTIKDKYNIIIKEK